MINELNYSFKREPFEFILLSKFPWEMRLSYSDHYDGIVQTGIIRLDSCSVLRALNIHLR